MKIIKYLISQRSIEKQKGDKGKNGNKSATKYKKAKGEQILYFIHIKEILIINISEISFKELK